MPTKSKLPTKTIVADDLVIEFGGGEYYPHAGEGVTYRLKRLSLEDYLLQLKAVSMQNEMNLALKNEVISDKAIIELSDAATKALSILASQIVSWDWTDDNNQPYPSPPTPEVLRSLSREEMRWLSENVNPVQVEPSGNGHAPST